MIQRFNSLSHYEWDDGQYVKYADHVAREAELMRLLKEYRTTEIHGKDCEYIRDGSHADWRCDTCKAVGARAAIKLQDIDTEAMRGELENVSALVLPDLVYQMVCALGELPIYHELITAEPLTTHRAAMLMAWTFEAGRRYGLQQALAIIDTTTTEFKTGTDAVPTAEQVTADLERVKELSQEQAEKGNYVVDSLNVAARTTLPTKGQKWTQFA